MSNDGLNKVIDYREILAKKKERESLQPPPLAEKPAENINFLVKIKNWWVLTDKKVKIEVVILLISLLLGIVFLSLTVRNAIQPMENKNPIEAVPLEMLNQQR